MHFREPRNRSAGFQIYDVETDRRRRGLFLWINTKSSARFWLTAKILNPLAFKSRYVRDFGYWKTCQREATTPQRQSVETGSGLLVIAIAFGTSSEMGCKNRWLLLVGNAPGSHLHVNMSVPIRGFDFFVCILLCFTVNRHRPVHKKKHCKMCKRELWLEIIKSFYK